MKTLRFYGTMLAIALFAGATIKGLVSDRFFVPISPSEPITLYSRTRDANSPYVVICLPPDKQEDARRHHIPAGVCPGGIEPFLKQHIVVHRYVKLTPEGAYVDGRLLPHTAPKPFDLNGMPLKHYPFGYYTANKDEFWVFSTYSNDSYDSRYFGPLPKQQLISYAKPVF